MAKTFSEWIATLGAVTGLGAGDKVPVVEGGVTKYVEGDDLGGGITALTGDVTASGTGSVATTIANGAVTNAKVATGIDAVKIADGTVSNAEFQYLGGVTSDIQTQLDAKVDENAAIVGATKTKITYDTKGLVTAGADATTADIADSLDKRYVTDAQLTVLGNTSGSNTGDQTNVTGNAGTVTVADAGGDTTTWVLLGTAQTGNLSPATDAGLTYNATTNALTATTFIGALTGNADTVTGFSGTSSGANTGDQTITNSSDATSHTVTLSATGGSVQFVEGSGVTLTTSGTGSAGVLTIAASGGGDIANGGNTTGAPISIGTNDDFGLNLETSGVTRMAITGGTGVGGAVTITNVTANTNTVQDVLTIQTNSTGTAAASFGGGILFQGESSTTDNQDMVRLSAIWTTATHASRASALVYSDVTAAGAITERFRFTPSSMTTAGTYTIGNSAQTLNIGGSSGNVIVATSATAVLRSTGVSSATGVLIEATGNNVNASGTIGNTSFTTTSGDKYDWRMSSGYAPTSGTGTFANLYFNGTFNQTGGANGITRGIYLNQTLTAVADFRGLEIAYSNASAKGIYQTGVLTTNNFAGPVNIGSTNAPVASTPLTIEYSTANTATVQDMIVLRTNSTGTAAASFGGGILFQGESSTTDNQDMVRFAANWQIATHASRTSNLDLSLGYNGGALARHFNFAPGALTIYDNVPSSGTSYAFSSITPATTFTLGSSVATTVSSTSTSSVVAVRLSASGNNTAASGTIGNTSFTTTSGDKYDWRMTSGFAPTSGTGTFRNLLFNGTYNQTGGANGITGAILINPTLTAVADFRALEIAANSSSAKGIYQTGASTTNNFVGATHFGSTSTPNSKAIVEMTSTTLGFLPPRMTEAQRDAISSPPAGLEVYNTDTNKKNFYNGSAWEVVTSA